MSDSWLTPNRHTRLVLDTPVPALDRPSWSVRRYAAQISRARTEANTTARVTLQPGNAWTLAPINGDSSGLLTHEQNGGIQGGIAPIGPGDVTLGPSWGAINTWNSPSSLSGMSASADLISAGMPAFTKRVASGTTWNSMLTADVAALAQPTLDSAHIPMDRMLSGKVTYPANCGFMLGFTLPEGVNTADTLLSFYFGGNNTVRPAGTVGGQFCLTIRGNGKAELREWNGANWARRMEFQWRLQRGGGNISHHFITIFPYGRNTIAFRLVDMGSVLGGGGFTTGGLIGSLVGHMSGEKLRDATFYRNNAVVSGYVGVNSATGPGTIRMDVRRDQRLLCQVFRLLVPASGTLTDLPFRIPFPVPAGTDLAVSARTFRPLDTNITVQLYSAADDVALTGVGNNRFNSFAGVQDYYARFTLTADADQTQTPVLFAYEVDVEGSTQDRAPVSSYGGNIRSVSVTGPDLSADQDSASVTIEDPTNALTALRTRGRIPASLGVYSDAGALTTILFQGEVAKALALKRGVTGNVYPSANWRQYDISLVGVWARLAEFVNLSLLEFHEDETAPVQPDGSATPWKITSIIRKLLYEAGFPADTLDIPDLNIRLWSTEQASSGDLTLQPTVSIAEAVQRFTRDYLGMALIWDPNAGARGMWRLISQPQAPYTPLAAFIGKPVVAGRLATHPNSYAAGYAPVIGESYRTYIRAPEANYVLVVGMEPMIPSQLQAAMYNPLSFDFTGPTADASSPDYLGRYVPIFHVDPLLTTPQAVAWVCRRIYDRACHAEKWVEFHAPLVLVTDGGDALQSRLRPLRIYDVVTVYGEPVLLRSVSAAYESDGLQMADYAGVVLTAI